MSRWMLLPILAALSCKSAPDPEPVDRVDTCDAGDAAWVERTLPLMWGRKPLGSAEIRAWTRMVEQHGRTDVVRAMATAPEYQRWWRQWITDALAVARTGDKAYFDCFGTPRRDAHDGSLTQHIRTSETPWDDDVSESFNMADVILDGLVADDLASIWQANLYARMYRPVFGANVSEAEIEFNRRVNFGEVFTETYLNRNLDCVLCHNSSFSTTDDDDARFDLTWQLPGRHETALFGSTTTYDKDALYSMFRVSGVVRNNGGRKPFDMHGSCGRFYAPDNIGEDDPIGQEERFFIDSHTPANGTIWTLERQLAAGANALSGEGLTVGSDNTVDGRESFAYLVGARITDLVYSQATGARLTIAHGFPRNLPQAARLQTLTDQFVESGFSLQTLLISITEDELYNPGLPEQCDSRPYGLPPVANPWSVSEDDPAERDNSPGDLVHRHTARVLQNAVHTHLDWPPPPSWRLDVEEADFQASIGTFLRESQPGFNGTDFQGLLAYQSRYASCSAPNGQIDWISRLLEEAGDRPVEDVVRTLKDRLIARSTLDEEERPLLEALLGDLSAPASAVDRTALRAFCGVLLTSPDYLLALVPEPLTEGPPMANRDTDACNEASERMAAIGIEDSTCE